MNLCIQTAESLCVVSLLGYELVGQRPYCSYGFNLGTATCEEVELTDNCTDKRADNYYLRRPQCTEHVDTRAGKGCNSSF